MFSFLRKRRPPTEVQILQKIRRDTGYPSPIRDGSPFMTDLGRADLGRILTSGDDLNRLCAERRGI